jgi:hypothetical protein
MTHVGCLICVAAVAAAGCWKDEFPPTGRALPTLLRASGSMTVDQCAQLAYAAGWAYFAVQYAAECYVSECQMQRVGDDRDSVQPP